MANRGRVRVEQGLDKRFYVYKEVDVTDDPDTSLNSRFDEVGSYDTEEQAAKAADKLR